MTRLADSACPHRLPAFFWRLCCPARGNLSRQNAATVATLSGACYNSGCHLLHKGITHQTFLRKIVCQQGCCSPLLETQSQGDIPLWIPYYFWQQWYPPSQSWVVSTLSKMKNLKNTFTMGWWFSDFPAWDIALFLQIPMCPLWRKQKKERFSYDFIWSISRRLTWRKLI